MESIKKRVIRMVKEKDIEVITLGQITLEDKRNYAKAMARALMAEYGKEICEKVLTRLRNSKI